ncbi:MAG: hypothetical protein A2V93_10725 [Ignavibacteria bacterium RBG_16_34_14]|nr:MAG: hypothetical protein A2V93_10725 [Ignavibacteria bacterium RBG_16_34_14]
MVEYMKTFITLIFSFSFFNLCFPQQISNKYLPLQIGNRWDYHIDIYSHGGGHSEDTLSIEISDTLALDGNMYFVFSSYPPWFPFSKYVREENDKLYFYNEDDSSDCFAYRFDLPVDSTYLGCWDNVIFVYSIDTSFLWGFNDIHQFQEDKIFSEHFGVYYFYTSLPEYFYDLYGCIISGVTYGNLLVNVEEEDKRPINFMLEQNYPNPFNPITTINYSIPENSFVLLKIYDLLGREISTLVSEEKLLGKYESYFDGSNLPSGVYLYRLQANHFNSSKKLLLIK